MSIPERTDESGRAARPRGRKTLRIVGLALLGVVVAVLLAFLFGLVVKALWNWLMPGLFGLKAITYWQALGIVLLAKILFGGAGRSRRDYRDRSEGRRGRRFWKWTCGEDVPDEAVTPPGNGKRWRHFRQYWQEEGRAAFEAYLHKMEARDSEPTGPKAG
jgi:hypothetical protein